MFALMTIRDLYRDYLNQLQKIYSLNEAGIITDWTFESIAGIQRADIIKTPQLVLKDSITMQLENCLPDLLRHKPVQYVTGEAWFSKMKFKVNENVLIPRPETEEVVSLAANFLSLREEQQPSVLDIGTGSGCIAIALKKYLPGAQVSAIDVSAEALKIARENAAIHHAMINFMLTDFLAEEEWMHLPAFDIIISNPPYIPESEKGKLDKNVAEFEPHLALFVPDDLPLLFYKKIAVFGQRHLRTNGKIFLEIHENFAGDTAAAFEALYHSVEVKTDLFEKQRMLVVSLPK